MNTTEAIERRTDAAATLATIERPSDHNKLARLNMRELRELASVFIESGAFPDIKSLAQAQVKILAGQELGFSPIVSMTGIHFFQGKVTIGSNLLASLIKDSGKYAYKVLQHSDAACEIAFYQVVGGEPKQLGTPVFYTIDDATKAGLLTKDNWKKYPKDMLFAACMRQGARRYCADILRGVTHDTDVELIDALPAEAEEADVPHTADLPHTEPEPDAPIEGIVEEQATEDGSPF